MRQILLIGCMAATLSAAAAVLTPEAALRRAMGLSLIKTMSASTSAPQLVYTQQATAQPAAYIFARGTNAGYIVVSADDKAVPVLGYCDYGTFDVADMPDGMKYWLEYYAEEIDAARTSGVSGTLTTASASSSREAIAPMLTTSWDQRSPYNDKCPLVGTTPTYTGCVATAMAQVMKYHNWPAAGKGSNSYSWNDKTLSFDFSTITFDWDNMLDSYGYGWAATDAQKDAVATLMYACGISVGMSYGTSSSGAPLKYCGRALVNNFNYDASLRYLEREYYSSADWENEVYQSLADGYPVLYSGWSNSSGHAFVCDGYSTDGYFHFNWGWGGYLNGYFKLSALNPEDGADSGAGYNLLQEIIVGIKPYEGQSDFTPMLVNMSDFTIAQSQADLGSTISLEMKILNIGYNAIKYKLGVAIVGPDGNTEYRPWTYNSWTIYSGYYTNNRYQVSLPPTLADGKYTVYPVFNSNDQWYTMKTKVGCVGSINMTVANSVATFPSVTLPEVTDYSFSNKIYVGFPYQIEGTIETKGEVAGGNQVYGMLISSSGNTLFPAMQVDLQAGESTSFTYDGTMPNTIAAGDYQFAFVVRTNEGYIPISSTINITINAAPATYELTLGNVTFESGSNHVPKNDLGVKTSLTCTSGAYYGTLDMMVYYCRPTGGWSRRAKFSSEKLYLNAGDSKDIVYHNDFSDGAIGEEYMIMFCLSDTYFDTEARFTLADPTTGINGIAAAKEPVSVQLYNLNGQLVAGRPTPDTISWSNVWPTTQPRLNILL